MIKSLAVKGLHGKFDFELNFNEDLNIITGKNGSGKTSILKLIWYILSGHIGLLNEELNFSSAQLIYNDSIIEVHKNEDRTNNTYKIVVKLDGFVISEVQDFSSNFDKGYYPEMEIEPRRNISSIFFPTFRRIEGGFSIRNTERAIALRLGSVQRKNNLDIALSEISKRLNAEDHELITAISTRDIRQMLNREYYNRLEEASEIQNKANQEIIEQLKSGDNEKVGTNNELVNEVKRKMEDIERKKESLMKPFDSLSDLVLLFFQNKGIRISDNISFGEKTDMLSSEKLSAGEKQMLSFLSYNAFIRDSSIFIDEPELSLHVDWQRELLPALINQGTKNQFFIATHSPFIYGMYPDKEIELISSTESVKA